MDTSMKMVLVMPVTGETRVISMSTISDCLWDFVPPFRRRFSLCGHHWRPVKHLFSHHVVVEVSWRLIQHAIMLNARITLRDGPMDGLELRWVVSRWPPPRRVHGGDLHRAAFGTYVLCDASTEAPYEAVYQPRVDDDYHRIQHSWVQYELVRLNQESE
jgi:hypothetical protein